MPKFIKDEQKILPYSAFRFMGGQIEPGSSVNLLSRPALVCATLAMFSCSVEEIGLRAKLTPYKAAQQLRKAYSKLDIDSRPQLLAGCLAHAVLKLEGANVGNPRLCYFTDEERQQLAMAARGDSNKDIGEYYGISTNAARILYYSMADNHNLRDRQTLCAAALITGQITVQLGTLPPVINAVPTNPAC